MIKVRYALPLLALLFGSMSIVSEAQAKRVNGIGINFAIYDYKDITFDPCTPGDGSGCEDEWYYPPERFLIPIGFYHKNTTAVNTQLAAMRNSGATERVNANETASSKVL